LLMQIISFTKWYTFIEFRISVIERSKNTTLIARNLDRLEQTATTPNKTMLLSLDYQDSINLKNNSKPPASKTANSTWP